MTVAKALQVLGERAATDPDLAEAIVLLAAGPDEPADPFGAGDASALRVARSINEGRRRQVAGGGLSTAEVVERIGSVSDRKGVDRRRRRGRLLGWRAGAGTVHPAWQFDSRRADTRAGLVEVLGALAEVTSDPRRADALMTASRLDLGGGSLADLFVAGRTQTVVHLIRMAQDQS